MSHLTHALKLLYTTLLMLSALYIKLLPIIIMQRFMGWVFRRRGFFWHIKKKITQDIPRKKMKIELVNSSIIYGSHHNKTE